MVGSYTAVLGDRSLFPELEARAYLNHAAVSPPSLAVQAAARGAIEDFARRGVSAYLTWMEQRERLRGLLARLIGAQPADIGLVGNTTQGVLAVALGFPWRAGDRVVVFDGDFPTNVTPWLAAARRHRLEPVRLSIDEYRRDVGGALGRLEETLRRGVRLVAVSAVAFQSGLRLPIEAIGGLCRAHGAELFVDAIQACGVVPLDVMAAGVDYLAAGGHKWMMGTDGTGMLFVHPDRIAGLEPVVAGWLSHEDGLGFLFHGPGLMRYDRPVRRRADFVEGGVSSSWGFAALEAGLQLIMDLGVEAIAGHVEGYLDALEAGLVARGFESLRAPDAVRRSGILGVRVPQGRDVVTVQAGLSGRGIGCSLPDGVLRFAPHWPNALAEVEVVLGAVDETLEG